MLHLRENSSPVLGDERRLIDGHHAVWQRGRLVGRSLLLGEVVADHPDVHVRLGYETFSREKGDAAVNSLRNNTSSEKSVKLL